jgi:hypothetical protein
MGNQTKQLPPLPAPARLTPPQSQSGELSSSRLVGKAALLEHLFPDERDRPTVRWLDIQCKRRAIPFIRLGRLIWFDVQQVKEAFLSRATLPRHARD